jgi:acetolactate synthase small subunit
LARALDAEVVEVSAMTVTLFFAGTSARLSEFLKLLEPYGVAELPGSGQLAVRRSRWADPEPIAVVPIGAVPA